MAKDAKLKDARERGKEEVETMMERQATHRHLFDECNYNGNT